VRSKPRLRNLRPLHAAAGVVALAAPPTAVALAAGQAAAQSAIQFNLDASHLQYDGRVKATGNATTSAAGTTVDLDFAPAGGSSWRTLTASKVRSDGSFTLRAPLRRSGLLRVSQAPTASARSSSANGSNPSSATVSPSSSRPVSVAANFAVQGKLVEELGNTPAHVSGRLLPALSGRKITLVGGSGGSRHTIASTQTGAHGEFDLRVRGRGTSGERLRVAFSGDGQNTTASAYAGRLERFQQTVASWYDDGGNTACGFHAQFGVANRDLPCGTKVTFVYRGRSVNAVVDDRGPFVAGRDWDLNQNTAGALGFGGVDTLWASL
jgi:rare lipoprotein A